jgi:hypothetical protein
MTKHMLLVLTNPVAGREHEFNDWYSNQHLGDVLRVPGFVSAQRFSLSPVQIDDAPRPWGYFAIYEIETGDLQKTIDALMSRAGTSQMPLSDAMQTDLQVYVVHAITERKTAG